MLKKGDIADLIVQRMNKLKNLQVDDIDEIIKEDAESVEEYVFNAIKSATIVIPKGSIIIDSQTGTNINDIELNNIIQ